MKENRMSACTTRGPFSMQSFKRVSNFTATCTLKPQRLATRALLVSSRNRSTLNVTIITWLWWETKHYLDDFRFDRQHIHQKRLYRYIIHAHKAVRNQPRYDVLFQITQLKEYCPVKIIYKQNSIPYSIIIRIISWVTGPMRAILFCIYEQRCIDGTVHSLYE